MKNRIQIAQETITREACRKEEKRRTEDYIYNIIIQFAVFQI